MRTPHNLLPEHQQSIYTDNLMLGGEVTFRSDVVRGWFSLRSLKVVEDGHILSCDKVHRRRGEEVHRDVLGIGQFMGSLIDGEIEPGRLVENYPAVLGGHRTLTTPTLDYDIQVWKPPIVNVIQGLETLDFTSRLAS